MFDENRGHTALITRYKKMVTLIKKIIVKAHNARKLLH